LARLLVSGSVLAAFPLTTTRLALQSISREGIAMPQSRWPHAYNIDRLDQRDPAWLDEVYRVFLEPM
jgi:hypothetical protein